MRHFSLAAILLSLATTAGAATVELTATSTTSRQSTGASPNQLAVNRFSQGFIGFDLSAVSQKIENAVLSLPWIGGSLGNLDLTVYATADANNAVWAPTSDRSQLPGYVNGGNWWEIADILNTGSTPLSNSYSPGDKVSFSSKALDAYLNERKDAVGFATLILSERGKSSCQNPCNSISFDTPTLRINAPDVPPTAPVPLPASVVLLGVAIGGLGAFARRRSV